METLLSGARKSCNGSLCVGFFGDFFFSLPAAVAIISGELGSFKYVEGSEGSS